MTKRKLILENGKVFLGKGFGDPCRTIGEVMFTTTMTGYQEMMTDPTNHGRIMVMSYPLIGNYGFTEDDNQGQGIHVAGLVVSEHNESPSNFRFTSTLGETMEINRTVGISGVDTRGLVKTLLKAKKPLRGMIVDEREEVKECLKEFASTAVETNEVQLVSCKRVLYMRTRNPKYTVAVIDTGVRNSIVRELNALSCNLVVLPYNTSFETIMKYKPNGIFFPNGPGSPESNPSVIKLAKEMRGKVPMMGIGLGFQTICLSYGARTERLPSGIVGSNIPVRDVEKDKILITSQNNCYEMKFKNLERAPFKVTHKNLLTDALEGIEDLKHRVIAVQFEPNVTGDGTGGIVYHKFIEYMKCEGV